MSDLLMDELRELLERAIARDGIIVLPEGYGVKILGSLIVIGPEIVGDDDPKPKAANAVRIQNMSVYEQKAEKPKGLKRKNRVTLSERDLFTLPVDVKPADIEPESIEEYYAEKPKEDVRHLYPKDAPIEQMKRRDYFARKIKKLTDRVIALEEDCNGVPALGDKVERLESRLGTVTRRIEDEARRTDRLTERVFKLEAEQKARPEKPARAEDKVANPGCLYCSRCWSGKTPFWLKENGELVCESCYRKFQAPAKG